MSALFNSSIKKLSQLTVLPGWRSAIAEGFAASRLRPFLRLTQKALIACKITESDGLWLPEKWFSDGGWCNCQFISYCTSSEPSLTPMLPSTSRQEAWQRLPRMKLSIPTTVRPISQNVLLDQGSVAANRSWDHSQWPQIDYPENDVSIAFTTRVQFIEDTDM